MLSALSALSVLSGGAATASAQSFSTDARSIGMGGVGDRSNLAWDLVSPARPYRAIPVPLGLIQVFRDLDTFNPGSEDFSPALALSYATNPLHYSFNRAGSNLGESFITDIVNAGLNPDLNAYRGFIPQSPISARSQVSPGFGKTFWLFDNGYTFHGLYAGGGPYLTFGTNLAFDDDLIDLLAGTTDTYTPNTSYTIDNDTDTQTALSFTGGYRLKLPLPTGASRSRDGIYIAANYSHLYGLRYEEFDLAVQMDTDDSGMLTGTSPVVVDRLYSPTGKGRSVDLAFAVVVGGWDFTGGVEGIGNHIDWRDLGARRYTLSSVIDGGDFTETQLPAPTGTLRLAQPLRYSGGFSFDTGKWAAGIDVAHGLQDLEFRGGLEYRLGPIDIRGGGRMIRDVWHPTAGLGLNVTDGFGVDVAMLGMVSNIEQARETGVAISLRFEREQ
jgi:hypothetical protein